MAVSAICIGVEAFVGVVALFDELQAAKRRRKKTHDP
jgi:predicted component of type VI protein secretion system